MVETNSTNSEKNKRDGESASELKDQNGVGSAAKDTTEQGVPKRRGRVDDPPQLVDETKKVVSPDIGAASVGVTLGAFESEIERMSKDADAILDSIRNEAAESPRIRRVVRDRKEALNKAHDDDDDRDDDRREALNKAHDDDDDWDDDMSEELNRLGSVSEEIRQTEIEFMRGLVDLDGDTEERDNETLRQTSSPEIKTNKENKKMKAPLEKSLQQSQKLPQQRVQEPRQTTGQQQLQKPPTETKGRADPALLIGVILVYVVIMIHVLRVIRNGLLDAEGSLMPISFR
jgi:hypothetical protein